MREIRPFQPPTPVWSFQQPQPSTEAGNRDIAPVFSAFAGQEISVDIASAQSRSRRQLSFDYAQPVVDRKSSMVIQMKNAAKASGLSDIRFWFGTAKECDTMWKVAAQTLGHSDKRANVFLEKDSAGKYHVTDAFKVG
jgi:hypothetical protein